MKTKALFFPWSIIFSLLFVCCFMINVSAQTLDSADYRMHHTYSSVQQRDTINFDNKDFIIDQQLLKFFPRYSHFFNPRFENGDYGVTGTPVYGSSVNFIVKGRILFLKRVTLTRNYLKDKTSIISKDEIKARTEELTGRKFDKNGLLKADWVSGYFYGSTGGEWESMSFHGKSSNPPKTVYKFVLKKGVLKKWTIIH